MTRTLNPFSFVVSSWILRNTSWLMLICLFSMNGSTNGAQCFCTAKDCKDPLCESKWCLIGFKSDVDLVQTCATEIGKALLNCARKLKGWQEVCSCTEDYCNTFSRMREQLKKYDENPQTLDDLDTENLEDKDARKGQKGSVNRHLIVLLVVVPLGIGAVTVCLVFLNYHCKMC